MASPIIPMIGRKFGRLTVISFAEKRYRERHYLCRCECGNEVIRCGTRLRNDSTELTSCGCALPERNHIIKHGQWQSLTYNTWSNMIQRCTNPNAVRYSSYGGRGITVCSRWLESFENFLEDMGERPSSEYSIERLDVNGNYTPENCCWATIEQQSANRRDRKKYKKCDNCGKTFNRRGKQKHAHTFCSFGCYNEYRKP